MRLLARWLSRQADTPIAVANEPLPAAVARARAILVIALAEAGDMVLLSPFLRELRRLAPSARVTLVCLPAVHGLFAGSADVDEVLAYEAAMPRMLRPLRLPRRARAFARHHLEGRFDLAIVPRWDTDQYLAAAVALFSGARRRVWHSEHVNARKGRLNAGFDMLFTDVVSSDGVAHEVERHLEMLRALGATAPSPELRLVLRDAEQHRATTLLPAIGRDGPLVALGIGAAHPKRRWPIARFAEVGRTLQREYRAHLVIVGGPTDVAAQNELLLALGPGATGVAGQLTFRESAAVLEQCRLFIGNDSAPMHLAAATGVACIEISCHPAAGDPLHNNAPERFAPWGVPAKVVRPAVAVQPCRTSCVATAPHCILLITPAMVLEAAGELLRRSAPTGNQPSSVASL
jgi:heptosyltransferase-2